MTEEHAGSRGHVPSGVVTFLLTDVESSTKLWRTSPAAERVMVRQAELIAEAMGRHAGVQPLEQGEGDSTVTAFVRASDALAAALDAQRALGAESWPPSAQVRVRIAVHTGESTVRGDGTYGGAAIIRCARLRALAHGGQVLVSAATAEVIGHDLPKGMTLLSLDVVQLDGFDRSERVYQLCHPALPSTFPALRRPRTTTLGRWPSVLIGRTRERAELQTLLATERLVTITGTGGAGKTRLAHAVAEAAAADHPDGVYWVELAPLTDDAQVASTVAAACGIRATAGVSTLDLLARELAESRGLIVLDNCEHLLDGCARLIETLLRAGACLRFLATAREPVGVPGEVTWRIPSLGLPGEGETDPVRLEQSEAVALFVARARAARPSFALSAENAAHVVTICRRLDGLPLALELAAARVRTLQVERVAIGLDDRFRLLTGGARMALARQRTLLASIEWSHELLDPAEQQLLRRVGVFAAPFELEAAEAVASDDDLDSLDVFDLLGRLVDKSLVQATAGRYRMLETIRQYAVERADAAGEMPALRDRHLAWFRRRVGTWRLDSALATLSTLDEIAAEAPDLTAALQWSLSPHREIALDIFGTLAAHCLHRAAIDDLRSMAAQVLGAFDEGSVAWLEALSMVGGELFFANEVGWMPAARRAFEKHRDALGDVTRGRLEQALSLGMAFIGMPDGIAGLERAAELGRAAGNRTVEIVPLLALVSSLAAQGERARVRSLLPWLDRHVPRDARMRFLLELAHANAATFDGDFTHARTRLEPHLVPRCEIPIATQAGLIALYTEDAGLARRAIAAAERKALGAFETSMTWLRAVSPLVEGNVAEAQAILGRESAWSMLSAALRVRWMTAVVALALDDVEGASTALDQLEPGLEGTAFHHLTAAARLVRAHVARARAEIRDAQAQAHAALEIATQYEMQIVVVDALETLAVLAADVHDDALVEPLLAATDAFRRDTGYRWRPRYQRTAIERLGDRRKAAGPAPSLHEAAERARRGRGERRRPDHGWDSLTPTEGRVVELLAAGLPNREIAAKLFVSLATVKTHLVHIFGKLDVRTRAELAAAATTRAHERSGTAGPTQAAPPRPTTR